LPRLNYQITFNIPFDEIKKLNLAKQCF